MVDPASGPLRELVAAAPHSPDGSRSTHTHTKRFVPAGETAAAGPQKEGHLRKGPDGEEIPSVPLDKVRAGESTSTPDHNTPPERRERRAKEATRL